MYWKRNKVLRYKISRLDKRYFHSALSRTYIWYKSWKYESKRFFKGKKSILLREPIADMLLMQLDQRENQFNQYCSYDFAVRYLAVENYYGKNNYGFELYKKMHMLRGNYGQKNAVEQHYEKVRAKKHIPQYRNNGYLEQHSVEQFENLLTSVNENGFYKESCVMGDRNLLCMNGTHRITIAFYKGMEYLNVVVHNKLFQRKYSIDFFWEHGFSLEEIQSIETKMEEILELCRERIGSFYCILFPPAEQYFDEITKDIARIGKDNITISGYRDYEWEVADFKGFLKGVYHFDSIRPKDFERKLYYILHSSMIKDGKVAFRIITINIIHPMYRLKKDNGMPESVSTVRLKAMIRERYKEKEEKFTKHYIGDYSHDVIIHSSDNYISNNAFRTLLSINRDLTEVMKAIAKCQYVFATNSPDKMSVSFPHNFFINEDFDIFIEKHNLSEVAETVYAVCKEIFNSGNLQVELEDSSLGTRVKIIYQGFIITMFDFMIRLPGIKQEYISQFIKERVLITSNGNSFFTLSIKNELIYRTIKYLNNPMKIYHRDFMISHRNDADIQDVLNALEGLTAKKGRRLWRQIMKL